MSNLSTIKFNGYEKVRLVKWKIKKGTPLTDGTLLFTYIEHGVEKRFKSENYGQVVNLLTNEEEFINPGQRLIEYEKCAHTTVMKDLCAECGLDLRKTDNYVNNASVSMIHSVPELKVSVEQAQQLGKADEEKLLSSRKLVLLVDLDQTLIHTTNHPTDQIKSNDVIKFRLYGMNSQLYYTKLRPFTNRFLESIAKYYELHICTFGARMYAHKIAEILDPEKKLFSHRILSRDECFDPQLKTGNLKALFPCGDSMVCIIDDREDVWNYQPNLISVKPYSYFRNTGDINSPNRQKDDLLEKAAKVLSNKQNEEDEEIKEEQLSSEENKDEMCKKRIDEKDKSEEDKLKEDESKESVIEDNELKEDVTKDNELKTDESKEESKDDNSNDKSKDESKPNQIIPKTDEKQIESDKNDDYLLYLLEILKKIHRKFYKEYDEKVKYSAEGEHINIPDLKDLIPSIRREVLKGVNVVFTGLIPTKLVPEKSKIWILAKQLGANVSRDIVKDGSPLERTTHLVASNMNTAKVQEAMKLKRLYVVNPIWLYACSQRWDHVDERLYQLEKTDDFRNSDKLKDKLSFDEQLFLNYDLVKLSSLTKRERQEPKSFDDEFEAPNKSKQSTAAFAIQTNNNKSIVTNPFPVYDPVTGKLIRTNQQQTAKMPANNQQPTTSKQEPEEEEGLVVPHSMVEFNPLSAFSDQDLKMMDEEVDDACSEEDDEDSMEQQEDNELDYDEENVEFDYGDEPAPLAKKRKREHVQCLTSSSSSEDTNLSFEDSNSNVDLEGLGAQLEKDFLGKFL